MTLHERYLDIKADEPTVNYFGPPNSLGLRRAPADFFRTTPLPSPILSRSEVGAGMTAVLMSEDGKCLETVKVLKYDRENRTMTLSGTLPLRAGQVIAFYDDAT